MFFTFILGASNLGFLTETSVLILSLNHYISSLLFFIFNGITYWTLLNLLLVITDDLELVMSYVVLGEWNLYYVFLFTKVLLLTESMLHSLYWFWVSEFSKLKLRSITFSYKNVLHLSLFSESFSTFANNLEIVFSKLPPQNLIYSRNTCKQGLFLPMKMNPTLKLYLRHRKSTLDSEFFLYVN